MNRTNNKLLVIKTSLIPESKSFSNALLKRFLEEYKKHNPSDVIDELNLNTLEMANITLNSLNMNFFFNEKDSDYYINLLKSYQKIIITTQMVNFNIPTTLKNFLDHILVANKTFSYKYSKKGEAIGLLKDHNIKIQILATQGAPKGWYPWGDHVSNLKGSLEFMGLIVCEPILIDGTKLVLDIDPNEYIKKWENEIKEKALRF